MAVQNFHKKRVRSLDTTVRQQLKQLSSEFWKHHHVIESGEQLIDFIEPRLNDENMLVTLLCDSEKAIGYVLAFNVIEHPFMPDWEICGYITNMYVQSDYRRQGLASELYNYVQDWLYQLGTKEIMLNVEVDNELASQFWKSQGFEPRLTRMYKNFSTENLR